MSRFSNLVCAGWKGAAKQNTSTSSEAVTRVLRDIGEIEEFRDIWSNWSRQPNVDIDNYLMLINSRKEIVRPHIVVLSRQGSIDALLIGRVEDTRLELKIGYKTIFRPRVRMLTFINGGLLGSQSTENCGILFGTVLEALGNREADLAFFNLLSTDCPIFRCVSRSDGWFSSDYCLASQPHRALVLPRSNEDFCKSLSPKVRKNQKWQAKRFLNDFFGNVKVVCYRDTDELGQAVLDTEQVARKTYQRGLGVGFFDSPTGRQRLHFESLKGWLRIYILYVAGQPCAFWIGLLYHHTFHSGSLGYDPGYREYSPGMFLIMKVIEDFCCSKDKDDVREIDFGFGDAQYKMVLGNKEWVESSVYCFARTLRGRYLGVLSGSMRLVDLVARRVLVQTGLVAKAKKIWRDRLRSNDLPPENYPIG